MKIKYFLFQKFNRVSEQSTITQKRLNKGYRKYYPDFAQRIDLKINPKKLKKLQAKNIIQKMEDNPQV